MASTKEDSPRAAAKRRQIREAAQRLFLAAGFASTSMEAIRREAGVSKETLYVYYDDKEALLTDVLTTAIDTRVAGTAALDPDMGSRQDLRESVLLFARKLVDDLMHPDYLALVRVVVCETRRRPDLGTLFRRAVAERALAEVATVVARARDAEIVDPVDPDVAARLLVGPLLTYVLMDGLLSGDGAPAPPSEETVATVVDLFLDALPTPR